MKWGTRGTRISLSGYFDYNYTDMLFKQFLIRTAGEHSKQGTAMDTSPSDIIEARAFITL